MKIIEVLSCKSCPSSCSFIGENTIWINHKCKLTNTIFSQGTIVKGFLIDCPLDDRTSNKKLNSKQAKIDNCNTCWLFHHKGEVCEDCGTYPPED